MSSVPPQCPLCRQAVSDLAAVEPRAVVPLLHAGLTAQFVHDMRGTLAPALNACAILEIGMNPGTRPVNLGDAQMRHALDIMQRNLRGANELLDGVLALVRRSREGQRLQPVGSIESLHRELGKLLRCEGAVDTAALHASSALIDGSGYALFLHAVMQLLLVTAGRTLEPRIDICYALAEGRVAATAQLPPEAEIDRTATHWHLATLLAAMYHGSVRVDAEPDTLRVRWSFPILVPDA